MDVAFVSRKQSHLEQVNNFAHVVINCASALEHALKMLELRAVMQF